MTIPSYSSTFPIEDDHRKPRTLVLCFDGTANEFSERNTNVVKLYSILKKDSPKSQLCYYQESASSTLRSAGIGTYFQPGVVSPLFRFAARTLDEMFAWYLSEHIMDGYKFLMQNYHEGDSVCIFGFSRGAYTARALAGMLHKVGLLSKDNHEQVSFAYKLYKCSSRKNDKLAVRFKKSFSREVPIEFLGVWDTVASVGIVNGRMLPFVGTNSTIKWFRQALSLDERRAKFRPNLYHRTIFDSTPKSPQTRPPTGTFLTRHCGTPHTTFMTTARSDQDHGNRVLEVWFAGSHSDVGGGHVKDTKEHALSNIPLRWMVREILKTNCHILFDEAALEQWGVPVAMIKQQAVPERTRETSDSTLYVEPSRFDAEDAVEKMGDQLKKNRFWWMLEIIPTYFVWQNEKDEWVGRWRTRMKDPYLDYVPGARYETGIEEYVV
ncbi:hypothetical protein EDB83DRAFT_2503382 [Lactarius deliciosus]|nr:hypothetical protein EDB83DRAFT_2503382 [Lactarius deliciosus]